MGDNNVRPSASDLARVQKARKVFLRRYSDILTHAKASRELRAYNSKKSAISINKGITFGLVPVSGFAYYAAQLKFPNAYVD